MLSNLEIIEFKTFWQSSEFISSNYFQIGQHVVLFPIIIGFWGHVTTYMLKVNYPHYIKEKKDLCS
jgi:hypothetical protein